MELFSNRGDGTFFPPVRIGSSSFVTALSLADMNGGGASDLVGVGADALIFANTGGTKVSLRANPSPAMLRQVVTLTASVEPNVPGSPPVTGGVSFSDNGLPVTIPTAPIVAGIATQGFHPGLGSHTIAGFYAGDGLHGPGDAV